MRVVRVLLGLLLAFAGLAVAIAGGVAAFWLVGSDDTIQTGEQHVAARGVAVVTQPDLLERHGPRLHVTARPTDGKRQLFVGVARDFDVASYFDGVSHTKLVQVQIPVRLTTDEADGQTAAVAAPAGLDWWVARATGPGTQSLDWPIADGPYQVVVMNADGKPTTDVQVDFGIELDGLFVACLVLLGVGVLLLALGLLLMFFRRRKNKSQPMGYQPAEPYREPVASWAGPSPDPGHRATRAAERRTASIGVPRAVALCVALSMATGCVAVPVEDAVTSLTRPAVSSDAGLAVVKEYNDVNNRANTRRDDALIATVETTPVLTASRSEYRIERALKHSAPKPFSYQQPAIAAPQYGSYPMRFVSSAGVSTSKEYRHLALWERSSAGSPWKLAYSLYPATSVKAPELSELRTPSAADLAGLTGAPSKVVADFARYLTVGSSARLAKAFTASPDTNELLVSRARDKAKDRGHTFLAGASDSFKLQGQPVTLMSGSGEAIVFAVIAERYETPVRPGYYAYWSTGRATAFSKNINYERALFIDYQNLVALAIPAKGKGKPRILAVDSTMVGAGGY